MMEGKTVSKKFISEHMDGSILDLSLCFLSDIPVQELAKFHFKTLDLSQNRISIIQPLFLSLTFINDLDLSRNCITVLPDNFGDLKNLQKLDLYRNQLQTLPLSFCQLKSLRWLDLRENSLLPDIAQVAGDCSNETECKACAKKIVSYLSKEMQKEMKRVEAEQEKLIALNKKREKQKQLKQRKAKKLKEQSKENRRIAWENSLKTQFEDNEEDTDIITDTGNKAQTFSVTKRAVISVVIVTFLIGIWYYLARYY